MRTPWSIWKTFTDYKVADISWPNGAEGNRHRRNRNARPDGAARRIQRPKPLTGARIVGCLHMTIQTAVLIGNPGGSGRIGALVLVQYLLHPGSCRRRHRRSGHSGVCLEGETEEEFWWCIEQTLRGPDGWTPNMILDDGGDVTAIMHSKYPEMLDEVRGLSEETTTGVHRLYVTWSRRAS